MKKQICLLLLLIFLLVGCAEQAKERNIITNSETPSMDIQKLLDDAWIIKKDGNLTEALKLYNQAFDILIEEARAYARKSGQTIVDFEENGKQIRQILPAHFDKSKEYLKQDKVAAVISNNMGTVWAELGEFETAKKFFNQAIELTPDGMVYQDPHIALEELKK